MVHTAIAEAVQALEEAFGPGFGHERGFVVLVEAMDTPESEMPLLGMPLHALRLEMTWRRHGCLVGLVLWGNAGDGVTFVCPELPGHAEEVQQWLRREL
jgi:hypothetical protein